MKSTLKNMVISLAAITLIASAAVGLVFQVTAEPIAQAAVAATNAALSEVLPEFDDTSLQTLNIDDLSIDVYTATKNSECVGYAIKSSTKNGFNGLIVLMVGMTPAGEVINVSVLQQAETPGLGTKMADDGNPLLKSIKGKVLSKVDLRVKKKGGDVDALTAATISSEAYLDAIQRAQKAFEMVKKGRE